MGIIKNTEITSRKVLLSMRPEFLNLVDEIANAENRSRSELIREAVRFYGRIKKPGITKNAIKNAIKLESLLD